MKQHKQQNGGHTTQMEIARVAAKILAEDGVNDYLLAKQRAIQHLHLSDSVVLPKNSDIQQQLATYLELFDGDGLAKRQTQFKKLACQIMELMEDFQPLAVGPVVNGVITDSSHLCIHVFAPTPEHIATTLIDRGIPYELTEQPIRFSRGNPESKPGYNFLMGGTPVKLCVFSEKERRKTPIDPVYGKSTKRLGLIPLKNTL